MNGQWQTQLPNSGKQSVVERKMLGKSWRSLRESNPSFQIEKFAPNERFQGVSQIARAKTTQMKSMAYAPAGKRWRHQ